MKKIILGLVLLMFILPIAGVRADVTVLPGQNLMFLGMLIIFVAIVVAIILLIIWLVRKANKKIKKK